MQTEQVKREDIKQQVYDRHDELVGEVTATKGQQGQLLTQTKKQLSESTALMSEVSQSQDVSILTKRTNVQQVDDLDPKESTGIKEQQGNKKIHEKYKLPVKRIGVEYTPTKLCVSGDELWVGGYNKGVFVYDLDLQPIKHITHCQLTDVTSVLKTGGEVLVSDADTGLHCLNQQGDYLYCVSEGTFSDVCLYNKTLYLLDYKEGEVCVFKHTSNKWVKCTQWGLSEDRKKGVGDKICATHTGVYISSWFSHFISVFSHSGEYQDTLGGFGRGGVGELVGPLISDVDSEGRLLVCDCGNHRFQVFDPETREWKKVTGTDGITWPMCGGLADTHFWAGGTSSSSPGALQKYEMP